MVSSGPPSPIVSSFCAITTILYYHVLVWHVLECCVTPHATDCMSAKTGLAKERHTRSWIAQKGSKRQKEKEKAAKVKAKEREKESDARRCQKILPL